MASTISILKPSVCFEVQKVVGISTHNGGSKTYHVQWAPSWISGFHLIGCEELIEQFECEQKRRIDVDIKVETVEEHPTHDQNTPVFDDEENIVDQDATQSDHLLGQQFNKLDNEDVNMQSALDIHDESYAYTCSKDTNYTCGTRMTTVVPTDSNLVSSTQKADSNLVHNVRSVQSNNGELFSSCSSHTDIHYSKTNLTVGCTFPSFQSNKVNSENSKNQQFFDTDCQDVINIEQVPTMSLHDNENRTEQYGEEVYRSRDTVFESIINTNHCSNADISEKRGSEKVYNCKNIVCEDAMNVNQVSVGNYNNEVGGSYNLPKPLVYFNREGTVHMLPNETVTQNKIKKTKLKKKSWTCNICYITFSSDHKWKMHSKMHHVSKDVSEHKTLLESNSDSKMQTYLHTGPVKLRRYKCSVCEYAFVAKRDLKRHVRRHTGERPFECYICEKRFRTEYYVKTHMKMQHPQDRTAACNDV